MASKVAASTEAGASVYTSFALRWIYDIWVLGISNSYAWRCPTNAILLPFFEKHVKPHHCDVGVGTGFYLAKSDVLKHPNADLLLSDLNESSLGVAKDRVGQIHARTLYHDIEKPLPMAEKFQSISLMYLLHCMPGPTERKAAIFGHLKNNLEKDGVLFGATILGKGVVHNAFGTYLMNLYNKRGIFGDNWDDGAEVFIRTLESHFQDVDVRIEGAVLLFAARQPR